MTFNLASVAELCAQPRGDLLVILLREAATFAECESLDQTAWRLADACLLLRQRMDGTHDALGLDLPTGLGALMGGKKRRSV